MRPEDQAAMLILFAIFALAILGLAIYWAFLYGFPGFLAGMAILFFGWMYLKR